MNITTKFPGHVSKQGGCFVFSFFIYAPRNSKKINKNKINKKKTPKKKTTVRQKCGVSAIVFTDRKDHSPITDDFYWLANSWVKFHLHVKRKVTDKLSFPLSGFYSSLFHLLLYLKKQENCSFQISPVSP